MARDARAVAEGAMPGWRAVGTAAAGRNLDAGEERSVSEPDQHGVDIEALRRKYLGDERPAVRGVSARALDGGGAAAAADPDSDPDSEHAEFVLMEPRRARDAGAGRKVVLVRGSRVVGSQG